MRGDEGGETGVKVFLITISIRELCITYKEARDEGMGYT